MSFYKLLAEKPVAHEFVTLELGNAGAKAGNWLFRTPDDQSHLPQALHQDLIVQPHSNSWQKHKVV